MVTVEVPEESPQEVEEAMHRMVDDLLNRVVAHADVKTWKLLLVAILTLFF